MENLTEILSAVLYLICTAAAARFIYYIIGEPIGRIGRPGAGEVTTGRPLSKYGVFVLKQFDKFEAGENERLSGVFDQWHNEYEIIHGVPPTEAEIYDKNIKLSRRRRLNFWQSVGACFMCFSTWIAAAFWVAYYLTFGVNLLFLFLLIPATVIAAKRF